MIGEPLSVLLVEDDADHAELVIRCFSDHRVANSVVHIRDGEGALDYLLHRGRYANSPQAVQPHLILLDLRLPGIDGSEVLRVIKTTDSLKRTPTIILTSSRAEIDLVDAYQNHANSYLLKPIRFEEFVRLVDDLGYYWLVWNRDPWERQ